MGSELKAMFFYPAPFYFHDNALKYKTLFALVLSFTTPCPYSTLNLWNVLIPQLTRRVSKLLHLRIIITIVNMVKHHLQDAIAVTIFDWDSYCYLQCLPWVLCCLLGAVSIGMAGGPGLAIWCDVASVRSVMNRVSSFTHLCITNLIHFSSYSIDCCSCWGYGTWCDYYTYNLCP